VKGPIVEVPDGAHSILGPSRGEQIIQCPGSVLASQGIRDVPSSYALEGTSAHTVSEWVRVRGLPAETYQGTTLRITRGEEYWDVKCGKQMALAVQQFCDRVAKLPGQELVEARVDYTDFLFDSPFDVAVPAFGTSDSIKLNDLVCYVGDFKFGTGVKKGAEMNEQLLLYSLGTYLNYRWAFKFDTFQLAIYQPRLKHFDQAEITLTRLLEWAGDVAKPAMLRALKPGAPMKAGSWCQFCKYKPQCAVNRNYKHERAIEARSGDFAKLGLAAA
jgi:hypothetical protein